jgi:predicted nucleic acid-binding protein
VLAPYGNPPLTNDEAWSVYQGFLAYDRIAMYAGEPPGLEAQLKRFALRPIASPKVWMDAYLAAFAATAGCRLVTTDLAFGQFAGLDVLVLSGPST